jgi:hypothetical protein
MPRFLPLFIGFLSLTACSGWGDRPGNLRDLDPEAGAPAELVVRNETRERKDFGRQMRDLLQSGRYDSLEHIARGLRQQRIRWPNGDWKLRSFYVYGFDSPSQETETQWKVFLGQLRGWIAARPSSVTAHVALGSGLRGYAWHARGEGWSHEVTDAGRQLFQKRLSEADSVLRASQRLPEYCPGMRAVLLRVALGQGWDRGTYDSVFNAAIEAEPSYESYYELKAYRLLPRWYGAKGEWERFAAEAADHIGGPEGDAVYARIVWSLWKYHENMFKDTAASWERTSRGYQQLLRTYPHSLELQSQYAILAAQAENRAQARLMFDRMGPHVDPAVWYSRERFVGVREWAMQ